MYWLFRRYALQMFMLCAALVAVITTEAIVFANAKPNKDEVKLYVDSVVSESFSILQDKDISVNDRVDRIQVIIRKNLDVPFMARFIGGRPYKSADSDVKTAFQKAYADYVVMSYGVAVKNFSDQKVNIISIDDNGDGEYTVKTEIISQSEGAQPVYMEYIIHNDTNGHLKVFDIVTEGIRMLQSQREEFSSTANEKGIEGLTEQLISQTNKQAGGVRSDY